MANTHSVQRTCQGWEGEALDKPMMGVVWFEDAL